jgi:hypothetical protein
MSRIFWVNAILPAASLHSGGLTIGLMLRLLLPIDDAQNLSHNLSGAAVPNL